MSPLIALDGGTRLWVEWIWGITLLIVVAAVVPLVLGLVYRLIRAARNIDQYSKSSLQAGLGIAGNTANITALNDTIQVAGQILVVAKSIDTHTEAIEKLLIGRATAGQKVL